MLEKILSNTRETLIIKFILLRLWLESDYDKSLMMVDISRRKNRIKSIKYPQGKLTMSNTMCCVEGQSGHSIMSMWQSKIIKYWHQLDSHLFSEASKPNICFLVYLIIIHSKNIWSWSYSLYLTPSHVLKYFHLKYLRFSQPPRKVP